MGRRRPRPPYAPHRKIVATVGPSRRGPWGAEDLAASPGGPYRPAVMSPQHSTQGTRTRGQRRSASLGLLALAGLALIAGCGRSPKDRLQGRWLGERVENFPPGAAEKALEWVKGAAFEFKASAVTVSLPTESPREGTFRVARVDGNKLTLTFQRQEDRQYEADFELGQDGTLRWSVGEGRTIVLAQHKN